MDIRIKIPTGRVREARIALGAVGDPIGVLAALSSALAGVDDAGARTLGSRTLRFHREFPAPQHVLVHLRDDRGARERLLLESPEPGSYTLVAIGGERVDVALAHAAGARFSIDTVAAVVRGDLLEGPYDDGRWQMIGVRGAGRLWFLERDASAELWLLVDMPSGPTQTRQLRVSTGTAVLFAVTMQLLAIARGEDRGEQTVDFLVLALLQHDFAYGAPDVAAETGDTERPTEA